MTKDHIRTTKERTNVKRDYKRINKWYQGIPLGLQEDTKSTKDYNAAAVDRHSKGLHKNHKGSDKDNMG